MQVLYMSCFLFCLNNKISHVCVYGKIQKKVSHCQLTSDSKIKYNACIFVMYFMCKYILTASLSVSVGKTIAIPYVSILFYFYPFTSYTFSFFISRQLFHFVTLPISTLMLGSFIFRKAAVTISYLEKMPQRDPPECQWLNLQKNRRLITQDNHRTCSTQQ